MKICEDKGYVKPTVFQGQYNPVCRRPEEDLLPILRKHGIVFNAYRWIALNTPNAKFPTADIHD